MNQPSACVTLFLAAAVSSGGAQETPPKAEFPAEAELVRLDLVIRDKGGRLVEDLRAGEVQVFEDGKACAVQSLRLVRAEGPIPSPRAGRPEPPPAAKPAESDERLASVVVLVFDQLGPEAAKNARAAALELAGQTFPRGSVFAVFKIGQGLSVLQSFTEDRARLAPAIEKATIGGDLARDPARRPGYDTATEEALDKVRQAPAAARSGAPSAEAKMLAWEAQALLFSDSVAQETQGEATLQPLLAIARGLARVQGRKSVLYFSEGLAVPLSVEETFRAAVSAANRANVSVHAFDARGLLVRSPWQETKQALGLGRETAFSAEIAAAEPAQAPLAADVDSLSAVRDGLRMNRQGNLRDLAESTGGFLVADTNDLRPGLARVVADLRAYYEVGFVPLNQKADGAWRAIEVRVSRPGVVVRSRRGYYALPPGSPAVLPYELPLAEALAASPMPREVEYRAATLRFAGGEAETETLVWVEVPLAGLTVAREDTTYRGRLSLLGLVKDEKGVLVARMSHDAPIEGPLAGMEASRQRSMVVKRTLRLLPGRYVLETAVQDRESGRLGTNRTAFEIPAPGPLPILGSVAIVRADEAGAAPDARRDPLRAGRLRATPLLDASFPQGTAGVSLHLNLYCDAREGRPDVDIELLRDGQAVAHARPDLPAPDPGGRISYIGTFPAAGLAPGGYEVRVRGRLGGREASEVTAFTITPRSSLAAAPRTASPSDLASPPPSGSLEARQGVAIPLATILERAARYVLRYEKTFSNLVVEEWYRQWGPSPKAGSGFVVRTLRSDLVFVRFPGPLPWATFRDVFEVDGQAVRDREGRLEKLFFAPKASDYERAQAILDESSRYNLGQPYRNINVPTLGLLFLRPENQARLVFKQKGTRSIAGFSAVEVAFEEKSRPTLVHDRRGRDVPASGRIWIDPARGTVLRTEVDYDFETDRTFRSPDTWEKGVVSTEYRREIALGCFVPDTMAEVYEFRGIGRIDSVARYSNYRHFEVSVGAEEVQPIAQGAGTAPAQSTPSLPPATTPPP